MQICSCAAAAPSSWFNVSGLAESGPHLFLRVAPGHLLLELLLQLLASPDGLLVPGEVGQLLQPRVGEVLRKMLAAPFVGRKEFLFSTNHKFRLEVPRSQNSSHAVDRLGN